MATILEFRQVDRSSVKHTQVAISGAAEIVFFPGVRYERFEEPAKPARKKRTRRRDRLEIDGTA